MIRPIRYLLALLPALSVGLLLPGCNEMPFTPRISGAGRIPSGDRAGKMIVGPAAKVGRGHARGFVILGADLRPASVGVFLTRGALDGLPATSTEFVVALPTGRNVAPFDHIGLDWNPQGHPPPGIYSAPHFDFHFYQIPLNDRRAIAGGPENNPPTADYVPAGYITTGESEPAMGVHYIDPTSPEFQPGGAFTRTLIYGFHEGEMIFIEPMVTTAFLLGRPNASAAIPQPALYPRAGLYPLSYSVRYDTERNGHVVSLDQLTLRSAP